MRHINLGRGSGVTETTSEDGEHRRKNDYNRALQPVSRITVQTLFVLVVLVMAGMGYYIYKQRGDEKSSCQIQARGLPANHALSKIMEDINTIISYQGPHPRPVPQPLKKSIKDLKTNLPFYANIERHQPQHRRC